MLALVVGALAVPSVALAASPAGGGGSPLPPLGGGTTTPGTGASGSGAPGTGTSGGVFPTQNGNATVSGSGDGITLVSHASARLRSQITFTGTAPASDAGATVEIQRLGHQTNWQWAPTVQATIGSDGSFTAVWAADHIGRFSVRALITTQQPTTLYAASTLPTVTITVYRRSIATMYGPGFFNRETACGRRLRPSTIGVANRTLKCGTQVAIYYRGQTMIVPVIDRGPYANNADWDLTEATAKALGISGTATIGAVSLPQHP